MNILHDTRGAVSFILDSVLNFSEVKPGEKCVNTRHGDAYLASSLAQNQT